MDKYFLNELKFAEPGSGNFMHSLYIPLSETNGVYFEYDSNSFGLADSIAQYLVLQITEACTPKYINIKIYDPACKGNYTHLHNLSEKCSIEILNKPDITVILNQIRDRIKEVKFDVLGAEYNNLKDYNEHNATQEPVHLYLVYGMNFNSVLADNTAHLIALMEDSARYGIYFIVLAADDDFKQQNKLTFNKDYYDSLHDMLQTHLFTIGIENNNFTFADDLYTRFVKTFGIKLLDYDAKSLQIATKIEEFIKKASASDNKKNFLEIPIGKMGRKDFYMEMGNKCGIAHGMIGGTTGSGKSYLINVILAEIAKKYSSDEIRLFLFDYKMGIEFRKFKNHPCLQYLMLSNNQVEEALKLFEFLIDEMNERSKKFGNYEDIATYNAFNPDDTMPYFLVVIDEFQQLFNGAHKVRNAFDQLLNQIARQGRSYGIHLLYSSNSFNGVLFETSTKNQTQLRIGFKMADSDIRYIMGDNRFNYNKLNIGQAVYNTQMGETGANKIVNISYFGEKHLIPAMIDLYLKLDIHKNSKPFERIIVEDSNDTGNDSKEKEKEEEYDMNVDF